MTIALHPLPAVSRALDAERGRIVEQGIREACERNRLRSARRSAAADYWMFKRACRMRPWLACQRIFPTRNGEMLDAWDARDLAKEEWREAMAEMSRRI